MTFTGVNLRGSVAVGVAVTTAGLVGALGIAPGTATAATREPGAADRPVLVAAARPATPKAVLLASIPATATVRFQAVKRTPSLDFVVNVDPGNKGMNADTYLKDLEPGMVLRLAFRYAEGKNWLKVAATGQNAPDMSEIPTEWMLLDPKRVKHKNVLNLPLTPDPTDVRGLLLTSKPTVKAAGTGRFTGKMNLVAAEAAGVSVVEKATLKKLAARAKAIPFTATVDSKGRFTTLNVNIPKAGSEAAYTYSYAHRAYGTAPVVTAPAVDEAIDAPDEVYDLLGL